MLFILYLFISPLISDAWIDFLSILLVALTLILNDWLKGDCSTERTVGFIGCAIASYILVVELLSIDMLIYLVLEDVLHLNIVLMILAFFLLLGWGVYRFERSWRYYQSRMRLVRHPSFK